MSFNREELYRVFGGFVDCRCGGSDKIVFNRTNTKRRDAKVAIYVHEGFNIAVIWDLKRRRHLSKSIKNPSISIGWEDVLPEPLEVMAYYQKGKSGSDEYEKVLAVKTERLYSVLSEYSLYSSFNDEDINFPNDISQESPNVDWCPRELRKKYSTERLARDARFRNNVLQAYRKKCAICRCAEEKILEAAHIIAVSVGGSDDINNGICLCANHHKMLDNDLIAIDYENCQLGFVAESVKEMPWFKVFCDKYKGRIIDRLKHQ